MGKRKIAVIGVGKIAQDQHLPVIDASDDFELAATVSTRGIGHGSVPVFRTPGELYAAMPEVGLVSICTPPGVRHAYVREALDAGKDVMMEKPPTTTISELDDLVAHAARLDRVLYQTWHSQFNPAVDRAKALLAEEGVNSARIDWRESVRKWHPGQDWVWEPGGFGVCDPGINAFSIFTKVMPFPVFVESAKLTFPANRQTPVDVQVTFKSGQAHKPKLSSASTGWRRAGRSGPSASRPARATRSSSSAADAPCASMARWCSSMATANMPPCTTASRTCSRRTSRMWMRPRCG